MAKKSEIQKDEIEEVKQETNQVEEKMSTAPASESIVNKNDNRVTVISPRAFNLRLQNNSVVRVPDGVSEQSPEVADHVYSKANGLRRYTSHKE